MRLVLAVVVACWAAAAVLALVRRPREPLGLLIAVASASAGVAVAVPRWQVWGAAASAAALLVLGLSLPDGRLRAPWRVTATMAGAALAAVVASRSDGVVRVEGLAALSLAVAAGAVLIGYTARCRSAGAVDRARLQWVGWGVVVAAIVSLLAITLHQVLGWPEEPWAVVAVASTVIAASLALTTFDHLTVRIDRLLSSTIVVGGLVASVAVVYLAVVLGLGDVPDDAARRLLAVSMVGAMLAATLALPARRRLVEFAHRRVYGDQRSPEEALTTFGSRMSRAVPMDELLLQLAETLRASMRLSAAEVWSGIDGVLDRVVSVPERGAQRIVLSAEELAVVARARVSGNAWIGVWAPALLDGREDRVVRVSPVAHSGELLGLITVERGPDDLPFSDEEERVLTELARQVGLALHNVRLDSALQASLDELEVRNQELMASRLRIVTAADESRRSIERNLHDGAQQHLVALAVKVGLVRQLLDADPTTANLLLDELRDDVQTTLTELRDLAHGIYPPLLRERGLAEALRTAANRSVLPASVSSSVTGLPDVEVARYQSEIEAAVYFCCLEAMQNAAKHAGPDATLTVSVDAGPNELRVTVADDGAGFDPDTVTGSHGFVNMADRVGAVDGRLEVTSAPGSGTSITCVIPAAPS